MISYPKFGSYTPMFRIPDVIDEFRVICFIFNDGVESRGKASDVAAETLGITVYCPVCGRYQYPAT